MGGHRTAARQRAEQQQLHHQTAAGFPEAAVVATPTLVYMGFGFEGITDAAARNDVMGRVMGYLLGS